MTISAKMMRSNLSHLLIFLMVALMTEKSGRSLGSSLQHLTIKLFMSQHVSFVSSTTGLNE